MKERIQLIDALRGLSVVLMVCHHFLFDLVELLGAPGWLFSNPVFDVLHYLFAGVFIALCGVSSWFSRSNVKRGLQTLGCAAVVTVATYIVGYPVWFGILHLLSVSMLWFAVASSASKVVRFSSYAILVALLVLSPVLSALIPYSADWFPPLPWMFVFIGGCTIGKPIREGRFPRRFYTVSVPLLPQIGRKSLLIYLLHQPVLYGVTKLFALLL